MAITKKQIDEALHSSDLVKSDAHMFLKGNLITKLEILAQFATDVILRVQDKFMGPDGKIREPKGPLKGVRYATMGGWLLIRVIKLVRDLAKS